MKKLICLMAALGLLAVSLPVWSQRGGLPGRSGSSVSSSSRQRTSGKAGKPVQSGTSSRTSGSSHPTAARTPGISSHPASGSPAAFPGHAEKNTTDKPGHQTASASLKRTAAPPAKLGPPADSAESRLAADGSRLSTAQQQNVTKLKTDLAAIKQGSQVTPEQKDALKNDLMAMADGATKPDPAQVKTLSNDLGSALADGTLSKKETVQLADDLQQVMNSANIPMSEVQAAVTDAGAILAASGVDKASVQKITADLKAIATTAQARAKSAAAAMTPVAAGQRSSAAFRKALPRRGAR